MASCYLVRSGHADYTSRVKVHYIGYDLEYDEWRNKEDVVVIQPENQGALYLE